MKTMVSPWDHQTGAPFLGHENVRCGVMNGEPLHHWKKEILAAGHFHTGYILKSKRWAAHPMLTPSVGKNKPKSLYKLLTWIWTHEQAEKQAHWHGLEYCLKDTKESNQILERSVGLGILMAVINLARAGHVFQRWYSLESSLSPEK